MSTSSALKIAPLFLITTLLIVVQSQSTPTVRPANHEEFIRKFAAAAIERTNHSVRYVPDYVSIPYPGGDVPADTGVCTDGVIRSYRAVGSICKRKCTKIWWELSMLTRTAGNVVQTRTLITAAFPT